MALRTSWPSSQLRSVLAHLVHHLAHARAGSLRHEDQHALAVGRRLAGEEQSQADDDDGRDSEHVGAAHRVLDMAEQAAGIGDELRQVVPAARAEQVDAEGREIILENGELGIHHLQQHARLGGQAYDAPDDRQRRQRRQHQRHQAEPPGTRQRQDVAEPARAGIEEHGEQDAGKEHQQAVRAVPREGDPGDEGQQDERRHEDAAPLGRGCPCRHGRAPSNNHRQRRWLVLHPPGIVLQVAKRGDFRCRRRADLPLACAAGGAIPHNPMPGRDGT